MVYSLFLRRPILNLTEAIKVKRSFRLSTPMPIRIGDTLPSIELAEGGPANKVNILDFCKNKKVVIVGVPGAFTPGCSKTHLPGYINRYDEIMAKGIDSIVCVAVNDVFVMTEWGKQQNADGKVHMFADADGSFTKAVNMDLVIPPLGGLRSKRYAMVVDNGIVKELHVEPDGTGLTCSLAERLKI